MRAIRALSSPAYQKARAKNPLLPEVHDRASAENTFKLLPLSLLALRVSKVDPEHGHEGHNHAKPKRVKGLWTVRIEQHQEANDDNYYIWLYEGSQWKQKLYAAGALVLVIAVVLFPLWPLFLRQGVWYLSMGMLGLIGLFFAMAIVRLILFIITMFAAPPGLWLYPNLFEDPTYTTQQTNPARSRPQTTSRTRSSQRKSARLPRPPQRQTARPSRPRARRASHPSATATTTSTATSRSLQKTNSPSSSPSSSSSP
jgi:translocation protein SEC62